MACKTPTIRNTELTYYDEYTDTDVSLCDIVKDWQTWPEQLVNESVFWFIGPDGATCSIRKEMRRHFDTDELRPVWYAHGKFEGQDFLNNNMSESGDQVQF